MRKRIVTWFSLVMVASFLGAATMTVVSEAKGPPCNKCRKDGCPTGFCYIDCQGCCYKDIHQGIVCFR